ncbi:MAG: DegV family protein [Actinomycetota bacterium]|nr:DegV family protein [Actinomycetota bacterium]MDD5666624.1 DegV family protein [Actinomycetota bacterium]
MAGIGIVTDSTAYLDGDYVKKNDIKVVPLKVIMDDVSYREGVDISNDEFYQRMQDEDIFPTTSQPSAGEFLEAYREMSERYDSLISIHISSGISGTCESARSAAAEMGEYPIEVIDSRFTGFVLMLFVQELVKARDAGKDMSELKAMAEKMIESGVEMFCVDTLEYLHRGGRIGGAQALMGSMLRIKPLLYLDGTIDALDKVRGSKKALERMVELAVEKAGGRRVMVTLTHVRALPRMNELKEMATKALDCDPDAIVWNETGPVIGSHVGPGTVGLGFCPVL